MFNSITTSEANRERIASLTNKLALGPENIIARLAFAYSLSRAVRLDLKDIKDSKGKIYSAKVLFGNYVEIYLAMICHFYDIEDNDKDIPKYVKLHIDHGLQEMEPYANSDGIDFLARCIEEGLLELVF
ncbi:DndE family protein [Dyadobacter aurulentus]|uniref:DndE family protein n=1 Tax=Dyadobacter sp. UC 10 TaxID=2605428 RepID=UPI0011F3C60A|nr:DndE family protein [Dyadobacter sp. UC 10]KAA0990405.1 DUF1832 domain-containing protein [Dyadobacter sp. UC 10]